MKKITNSMFWLFCKASVIGISNEKELINDLNVFPVPDGDTGFNMLSTLEYGFENIKNMEKNSISDISNLFSKGALMGARGNSGVILSQILRGFSIALKNVDNEIDVSTFKKMFENSKIYAYKAVSKPVDGTILSVISFVSQEINKLSDDVEIEELIDVIVNSSKIAVDNTPNQLKVLKEANVVDSGGMGLLVIFKYWKKVILNEEFSLIQKNEELNFKSSNIDINTVSSFENIGYCTEFLLKIDKNNKKIYHNVEKLLNKFGDSIVLLQEDDLIKIHVHTKDPGFLMHKLHKYGQFAKIKIENMVIQVHERENKISSNIEKEIGIIVVSSTNEISEEFKNLGVDLIIDGGQTSNPSIEEILNVINKLNTKNIIILPNNKNIILAAEQASKLVDKNVVVIKTKGIGQGFNVCYEYNPKLPFDELVKKLEYVVENSISCSLAIAIKNSKINGFNIKGGDSVLILDGNIIATHSNVINLVKEYIEKNKNVEFIQIFVGKNANENITKNIIELLNNEYNLDVEEKVGNQTDTNYILVFE